MIMRISRIYIQFLKIAAPSLFFGSIPFTACLTTDVSSLANILLGVIRFCPPG